MAFSSRSVIYSSSISCGIVHVHNGPFLTTASHNMFQTAIHCPPNISCFPFSFCDGFNLAGSRTLLGGAAVVLNGEAAAMSYCPHPGDNRGSFLAREPSHVSYPCSMASKGRALAKGVLAGTGPSPWGFHGTRRRMSSTGQRAPPISQVLFDNEA